MIFRVFGILLRFSFVGFDQILMAKPPGGLPPLTQQNQNMCPKNANTNKKNQTEVYECGIANPMPQTS